MGKSKEQSERSQKGKMSFVMFQLEGSDETLQKGLQAIEQAFEQFGNPQKVLLPANYKTETTETSQLRSIEEINLDSAQDESVQQDSKEELPRPRKTSYPTPEVIEIDMLSPVPFKDFVTQKGNPAKDFDRYLVAAAWFKEHHQINEVSGNHIYTCYRHMGWNAPKNVAQPLYDLKRKSCFGKGTKPGHFAINHIGENEVRNLSGEQVK